MSSESLSPRALETVVEMTKITSNDGRCMSAAKFASGISLRVAVVALAAFEVIIRMAWITALACVCDLKRLEQAAVSVKSAAMTIADAAFLKSGQRCAPKEPSPEGAKGPAEAKDSEGVNDPVEAKDLEGVNDPVEAKDPEGVNDPAEAKDLSEEAGRDRFEWVMARVRSVQAKAVAQLTEKPWVTALVATSAVVVIPLYYSAAHPFSQDGSEAEALVLSGEMSFPTAQNLLLSTVGNLSLSTGGIWDWIENLSLPTASIFSQTSSVSDQTDQDYVEVVSANAPSQTSSDSRPVSNDSDGSNDGWTNIDSRELPDSRARDNSDKGGVSSRN